MGWETAITAIFSFLLFCGELWVSKEPERKKEARNEAIRQSREDIDEGNVAAVNNRVDSVLSEASDSASGQHSDADITERINDVLKS